MKFVTSLLILISASLLYSCGGSTDASDSLNGKTIALQDYGSSIEQAYYKVWSDSSREEFGRITTVGGATYVTIVDDAGYEYFYSQDGFAGFIPPGGSLILFDSPMPSLPDTLTFGKTYTTTVTFTYAGTHDTLKTGQTLVDSSTVVAPCGTFNACIHFRTESTLSGGEEPQVITSESWLAKGPSDVKRKSSSGTVALMVRGYVNGQSWGEGLPKRIAAAAGTFRLPLAGHPVIPLPQK